MKPQHFLCSPSTSSPLFISYKYSFLQNPKLSVKSHFSLSTRSQFWGISSVLQQSSNNVSLSNLRKTPFGPRPIRAVVKRRKELLFDNVIQRDKKLKLVFKIQKILVSQPDRIMSLSELGKYRTELGLDKKRQFIALLRKFPAVFDIEEEGIFSLKFKLTPKVERLYLEEMRIRNEMEDLLVVKLRKLLVMSLEKQILLGKIAHLRTDLGLPLEFCNTICHRYPQYFKVVSTERGPVFELTHWDLELAVSAAQLTEEENRTREVE